VDFFYIPTEKGIDIMAAESEVCGFNQCLVKAGQFFAAFEINVGCKLTLVNAPVIGMVHRFHDIREQAVYFFSHAIKRGRQLFVQYAVGEFLCSAKVFYIREGVVVHGVMDALFGKESGKVFMAIEVYLNVVGKPGLDLQKHPVKLFIIIVKVIVPALGGA